MSDEPDPDERNRVNLKFMKLFHAYQEMVNQSFSESKDLDDTLRFLPGVVVQKYMSMKGMADLYRVNPDLLKRLTESTIASEPQGPFEFHNSRYILDEYLSDFLQDRDRSQLYYCDPMLQHISICRHFLSLLDESNAFNLQS